MSDDLFAFMGFDDGDNESDGEDESGIWEDGGPTADQNAPKINDLGKSIEDIKLSDPVNTTVIRGFGCRCKKFAGSPITFKCPMCKEPFRPTEFTISDTRQKTASEKRKYFRTHNSRNPKRKRKQIDAKTTTSDQKKKRRRYNPN